jgi:hypothetical protein
MRFDEAKKKGFAFVRRRLRIVGYGAAFRVEPSHLICCQHVAILPIPAAAILYVAT